MVESNAVREGTAAAAPSDNPAKELVATTAADAPIPANGTGEVEMRGTQVSIGIDKKPSQFSKSFQMAGLPFTPVSLAWRNIDYFVTIVSGKGKAKTKVEKQLLKGINGFSQPGTLTALMGSSGAGKTTLMDVIAGRKTTGRITGDILVNGRPKETISFNRLTGYVEQNDIHMGLHTVREALDFSAHIRLPASIGKAQRDAWVTEVIALVGLGSISDRVIGDAATPGLAPGQMKLVTIAVELVANPSVLFLDEPTSGLDAPSAFRIMTAVKRISQTGRSVLCTIHQPSSELFFMFDRLLLLRSGGEEVFFSDIGPQGRALVDYFEHRSAGVVKHPPRLPLGQNPANWMLDVIGSGVHSDEGGAIAALDYEAADWHQLWKTSELQKQVYAELGRVSATENAGVDAAQIAIEQPYVSWWTRYVLVQQRYFVMHWRNAPVNLSRCILMLAVGILFGLIYRDVNKTTYSGVQAFLAVIFLGLGFPAAIASASALPSLFRQRAVYYRESTVNMYDYWIYSTAVAVVETPYIFFTLALFLIPFYFLVGFESSGTLFFKYYLVLFIQALVFSFMSHVWLALMPSQISSNIINGLFLSLFFVFGGVFIRPASIRTGWKWFYYLDPLAKSLIAGALPQFYCDVDEPNNTCTVITVNSGNGQVTQPYAYEYIVSQLEGANSTYWPMIGYLLAVRTYAHTERPTAAATALSGPPHLRIAHLHASVSPLYSPLLRRRWSCSRSCSCSPSGSSRTSSAELSARCGDCWRRELRGLLTEN